jgi:signal transduction histidine kinase
MSAVCIAAGGTLVTGDLRAGPGAARFGLAELIEADRPAILSDYEQRLVAAGSPIVGDSTARQQAMAHAEQILSDVLNSLRAGRVQVDEGYNMLAWEIGTTRAAQRTHPRESLRAASMFFETTLTAIFRHLRAAEESIQFSLIIVLALNQSISVRIRGAAATYASYLLDHIHESHVEERRRIARELHDRIGSGVSLAYRQLELYEIDRLTEPVRASTRVEAAQQAILDTMENLRAITSELRLQEPLQSLEKALLTYLDSVRAEEVNVRLQVSGDETWMPSAVSDESFLILREAIRNALGHGQPATVLVRVDIAPHELRAVVVDDGMGFDSRQGSSGVGLSSMQERAALMGGTVTVSSQPGRGTQVELLVPLPGQRDEPS